MAGIDWQLEPTKLRLCTAVEDVVTLTKIEQLVIPECIGVLLETLPKIRGAYTL